MPIRSTGRGTLGGQYSGTHTGYGTQQRPGFDFGPLLDRRWRMQEALQKEQLRNMIEQRERAKRADLDLAFDRRQAYAADKKASQGKDYSMVQAGGKGVAGPGWNYRPNQLYRKDKKTGETSLMYAPDSGSVSGGGSSTQGGGNQLSDLARATQVDRALATHESQQDPYSFGGAPTPGYEPSPSFQGPMPEGLQGTPGGGTLSMLQPSNNDALLNQHRAAIDTQNWEMPLPPNIPDSGGKHGGYVPETKKYKLHKGETVLTPEQTQAAFPGMGPGPKRQGYQTGSMTPEELAAWERYRITAESGGLRSDLPALRGPGGPGTTPYIPRPEQGLLESGERGLTAPSGRPYDMPGTERLRSVGRGSTGTSAPSRPQLGPGRAPSAATGSTGSAAATKSEGAAGALKKATKSGKGRAALLGLGLGATGAVAGLASGGEGFVGGAMGSYINDYWAPTLAKLTELGFGEDARDAVVAFIGGGTAPDEASINKALDKIGQGPVPPGSLGGPTKGKETAMAVPDTGVTGSGSKDDPFKLTGRPEGKAEEFERYVSELKRKSELSQSYSQVASARAQNLETQINKRPYADNKGLDKMMKSRTKEADRHSKNYEKQSKEYQAIRTQQQELDSTLAAEYQKNQVKQIDTAFDAIETMWKSALKMDDGAEKWAQHGVAMMAPYYEKLSQMYGGDVESTRQALYKLFVDSFEDPSQITMLKMQLQGQ